MTEKELKHQLLILSTATEELLETLKGAGVDDIHMLATEMENLGWRINKTAGRWESFPTIRALVFSTLVDSKLKLLVVLRRGILTHYAMYYSNVPSVLATILPLPLSGMRSVAGKKYGR